MNTQEKKNTISTFSFILQKAQMENCVPNFI